jgi:alanine racemase
MTDIRPTAPGVLTIDLGAVAKNYRIFKEKTKVEVAGVLKAHAYGCGKLEVFQTLFDQGCRTFFVATPDEALTLRKLSDEVDLIVLGGVYDGAEQTFREGNITPVLNSIGDIERWASFARKKEQRLPAVIHFDTAMNRLGLGADETERLIAAPALHEALNVKIVMSHFACSDEKDHPLNEAQAARFARIAKAFPNAQKSLSNSSGIFRSKDWHYDLVRPGYAMYGGNPTPEKSNPMNAVVKLDVRVLQTRNVKKGESAGYNATYVFEKDTTLATVSMGYADGFLRSGSNSANLYWKGRPCPIVGRVSMDLIIVDTGNLTDGPKTGEWLEVLGPHQDVDQLATACNTIGYEILTSLRRSRYHRSYTAAS